MKITSYALARPAYYDRSATGLLKSFLSLTSPHGATTRWTTTISAGNKAIIEFTGGYVARETVATTSLNVVIWCRITSGSDTVNPIFARSDSNTVGQLFAKEVPSNITLYAGEVYDGISIDGSTGGTLLFAISTKLTTFTA